MTQRRRDPEKERARHRADVAKRRDRRNTDPEYRERWREQKRRYRAKQGATPQAVRVARRAAKREETARRGALLQLRQLLIALRNRRGWDAVQYKSRYRDDPVFRAKEIARRWANKVASGPGDLTREQLVALFVSSHHCAYCSRALTPRQKTLDHVVPRSRGGAHSIANVVIACRECNTTKHARTPAEWRAQT